jgi:hypothetical protein
MTSTLDKDNGMRRYDDPGEGYRALTERNSRASGKMKNRKAEASTVVMEL